VDLSRFKDVAVYVAVGLIVAAPLFYFLGYTTAEQSIAEIVSSERAKCEFTKKILEAEMRKLRETEGKLVQLKTKVERLEEALKTVRAVAENLKTSGEYNGVTVSARGIYVVPRADFCINVDLNNTTDFQKTLEVWLAGEKIREEKKKITLYPGEARTVQLCGRAESTAVKAEIVVNGKKVLATAVLVE